MGAFSAWIALLCAKYMELKDNVVNKRKYKLDLEEFGHFHGEKKW